MNFRAPKEVSKGLDPRALCPFPRPARVPSQKLDGLRALFRKSFVALCKTLARLKLLGGCATELLEPSLGFFGFIEDP